MAWLCGAMQLCGQGCLYSTGVKLEGKVSYLGYLLAMEAHGCQGIVQVCVVNPVVRWQLHGLLSPLL